MYGSSGYATIMYGQYAPKLLTGSDALPRPKPGSTFGRVLSSPPVGMSKREVTLVTGYGYGGRR